MIDRKNAKEVLNKLIEADILQPEIEEALSEVVTCLDAEMMGYLIWGADDDYSELFISYLDNSITDTLKKHRTKVFNKYRYTPSSFELSYTE